MPLGFSIIGSTVTFDLSSGERPRALWALLFIYDKDEISSPRARIQDCIF